jgi:hypothetical protein
MSASPQLTNRPGFLASPFIVTQGMGRLKRNLGKISKKILSARAVLSDQTAKPRRWRTVGGWRKPHGDCFSNYPSFAESTQPYSLICTFCEDVTKT